MITKWTNIKSVVFELERIVPKEFYNESRLIEDCMRAVDRIGAIISYQPKIAFKKVTNYKTCLPLDCLQISQIAYKTNWCLTTDELTTITEDLTRIDTCPAMDDSCLPYQIWFDNHLYSHRNWEPLKLSTNTFALAVHADNCPNLRYSCQYEYTVTPDKIITTNFKDGYLAIAYYAYPTDCDGVPMIPDDEDYKEALRAFVQMNLWEIRWNLKEEGAYERYLKYQQLWSLFKAKGSASIRMPDLAEAENLNRINNRLIPKTRRFETFFSNLNSEESLSMVGFNSGFVYR